MTVLTRNVPDYVPVAEARKMPGIRIAFCRGVPGPWGIAARAIYEIKGLDFVAVPQEGGGENRELKEWTGQTSAPVLMRNDDRIRSQWSEMLVLAEQLSPEPRLIPEDEEDRITALGISHEMCGDDGLGWNIRLLAFSDQRRENVNQYEAIFDKYGSPVSYDHIRGRIETILIALAARLERQAERGSEYLVGVSLSAADIYWAAFSNLIRQMAPDLCTQPDFYAGLDDKLCAHLRIEPAPILFEHRDRIVRRYFRTPIAF